MDRKGHNPRGIGKTVAYAALGAAASIYTGCATPQTRVETIEDIPYSTLVKIADEKRTSPLNNSFAVTITMDDVAVYEMEQRKKRWESFKEDVVEDILEIPLHVAINLLFPL